MEGTEHDEIIVAHPGELRLGGRVHFGVSLLVDWFMLPDDKDHPAHPHPAIVRMEDRDEESPLHCRHPSEWSSTHDDVHICIFHPHDLPKISHLELIHEHAARSWGAVIMTSMGSRLFVTRHIMGLRFQMPFITLLNVNPEPMLYSWGATHCRWKNQVDNPLASHPACCPLLIHGTKDAPG